MSTRGSTSPALEVLPPAVRSAIEARGHGIRAARRAGTSRATWWVATASDEVIVKSMTYERDPAAFRGLLNALSALPDPFCPRLLDVAPGDDTWFAIFEHVARISPPPDPVATGRALVTLLARLRSCDVAAPWPLELIWMRRLAPLAAEPDGAALLAWLREDVPSGDRGLAHGDLLPQNLVWTPRGPLLVDWEEVGGAPCGFDGGWLLAHARVRGDATIGTHGRLRATLLAEGIPRCNLRWFEGLGLARLLWRTTALELEPALRTLVRAAAATAVREFLSEINPEEKPDPCC